MALQASPVPTRGSTRHHSQTRLWLVIQLLAQRRSELPPQVAHRVEELVGSALAAQARLDLAAELVVLETSPEVVAAVAVVPVV